MKRSTTSLWPLLVAAVALALTGWLWQHERQTQNRRLRDNFDFSLRQTANRVEQRLASYEQMLRGVRGLFEASSDITRDDFTDYVDALLAGSDFAGLRLITYAPLLAARDIPAYLAAQRASGAPRYDIRPAGQRDFVAPMTFAAPSNAQSAGVLGLDPLADPQRRALMLRVRDSGGVAITDRVRPAERLLQQDRSGPESDSVFLMLMPVYKRNLPVDSVAARRASLLGWVVASFRVVDLMASLYGERTPGLDVRIHDGIDITGDTLIYPPNPASQAQPASFTANEYLSFAGHTWTLSVRSRPDFERRFGADSGRIIVIAGTGLSLMLAWLTWLLATGRERAHDAARAMTRQLRDSAEGYRRIVETANEGIWSVDADGATQFVNPKLQQLLGYGDGEMLGRPWRDFMDTADCATIESGALQQHDVRLRRHDGSDVWAALSTSAITAADGSRAGVLAMVTDMTERRQADANRDVLEAQLRQSQKMEAIGTLAGGIAHDFNNILAAILGNVALLRQDLQARPAAGEPLQRLEQIGKGAERARSLVQQIVAFSRRQPHTLVAQPLRPLLEETVALLRSILPARVELETRFGAAPVSISADATQFQQVLMNLCTNAWHALHDSSGRIVVGLDAVELDAAATRRLDATGPLLPGPHAHVWVSDDGSGMDEATRQRAFEPFFTTKPVGQGTGLGLSVVHGIVSSHRGAIALTSSPGNGSRFDLYFPLLTAPAAAVAAPDTLQPPAARGHGEHVLYVDDDPVMRVMVESLLQRDGYRVSTAADPRVALGRLRAGRDVDIVVTDFNMPEMSGLELAAALAALHPTLPVILTSGYVSDSLRSEVRHAGVRQVIQKEYTLEQLGDAVRQALAGG